jgi:hypothetical protein
VSSYDTELLSPWSFSLGWLFFDRSEGYPMPHNNSKGILRRHKSLGVLHIFINTEGRGDPERRERRLAIRAFKLWDASMRSTDKRHREPGVIPSPVPAMSAPGLYEDYASIRASYAGLAWREGAIPRASD